MKFPLFLKDTDDYMYIIDTPQDLDKLEAIDIESNEYIGWDCKGRPIILKYEDKNISAFIASNSAEYQILLVSILDYAKRYGDKQELTDESLLDNPKNLFAWADSEAKENHKYW